MGLAVGKAVTAVLENCDVCDVNIVLEALVGQIVEKNKINIKNLQRSLCVTLLLLFLW